MKANSLKILCFCLCVATIPAIRAQAPPPPPPGGVTNPGGVAHPGIPGAPGSAHDGSKQGRNDRRTPDASRLPNATATEREAQPRNALQFGPVGRWWDDKSVATNIGISRQQQQKMDSIFTANRPAIVNSYKAFLKAQDHLQSVNKAAQPDQAQVFAAIDAVNQARSDLQKAASAMLLQIRSEMSSDQVEKLEKLQ